MAAPLISLTQMQNTVASGRIGHVASALIRSSENQKAFAMLTLEMGSTRSQAEVAQHFVSAILEPELLDRKLNCSLQKGLKLNAESIEGLLSYL